MKNKNRIYRAAALLLVLCFISTVMISGTFAKYTSEYSGSDTALVAKWDVKVEGDSVGLTDDGIAQLNLFDHLYDTNILTDAGNTTKKIIAPGVDGSFVLSVTNKSDVAAGVTFGFTVEGSAEGVPIEYSFDDNFGTKYETVAALAVELNGLPAFKELDPAMANAETQTVYWRWSYEPTFTDQTDAKDTALGTSSVTSTRSTYILNVTATATQLEPGSTTTTP